MRIIGTVAFSYVRAVYRGDHPLDREHRANTNGDGERALEMADEMLGTWVRVLLTREEVLGITLPWHLSEGGGFALVPKTGTTVGEAAELVRSDPEAMKRENPVCAEKLDLFRRSPHSPIYLSTSPIPHPDYADLRVRSGLIHLDGLHRSVAWALSDRLAPGERTEAFVAGVPETSSEQGPPPPRPDTDRTGGPRP